MNRSHTPSSSTLPQTSPRAEISDYYDDTLLDYDMWSPEGYLHFGYWRPYLNPFVRRPMLEEMNRFIFQHLGLADWHEGAVADLGCGVGAVSRFGSQLYPQLEFHAMSISPGQIASAMQRHSAQRVTYHCGDYHTLPFEDESISGVFYLESLCHSTQPEQALNEAARVLKPGGRIVMTDGYLRRPLQQTSPLFRTIVKGVAHNWAVPMFHELELARRWTGDGRLRLVKDIECGWRLGPSALHAAHLTTLHFLKLALKRGVTSWQWRHLTASAYTIALGLYRRHFHYHLLAFEKGS
ncbi:MAG: methyltransferase domain-containing protein [Pirellulaceae bacterium]|jgi:MPBQ/MSBQ methyltransferase|nr:methyltransferase domain-containing protein [Pirellulaceae bacterium]